MNKLQTTFLGVTFPNPLILPSGIIQEIKDHKRAEEQGIGGSTLKSLTVEPREGNPLPRIAMYKHGYLNSVGLRNPGIQKGVNRLPILRNNQKCPSLPVFLQPILKTLSCWPKK